MKATIKDVATYAGVSVSTVSRCLNNYPDISRETKEKIYEAIKALDYIPSSFARNVAQKHTRIVGLTIPDIRDSYFSQSAASIQQVMERNGYQVFYGNLERSPDRFLQFLKTARGMNFEGIIITPDKWTCEAKETIAKMNMPVIALRRRPPKELDIPFVDSNHYQGATLIMCHLASLGHEKIGHIVLPTEIGAERREAYIDYCVKNRMKIREAQIDMPANILMDAVANGNYACEKLLKAYPDTTAIFAASDQQAIGALDCLRRLGKRVPDDISVAGIGDMEYSVLPWFDLTTLSLRRKDMGKATAEMLLKMIRRQAKRPKDILFGSELVVRTSTARL